MVFFEKGHDYLLCQPPVSPACCYSRCDAESHERRWPRYLPVWNITPMWPEYFPLQLIGNIPPIIVKIVDFSWRKILYDFNNFLNTSNIPNKETGHIYTWTVTFTTVILLRLKNSNKFQPNLKKPKCRIAWISYAFFLTCYSTGLNASLWLILWGTGCVREWVI